MSPQHEEQRLEPQIMELAAGQAELPPKSTASNSTGEGQRRGSDDHRPATSSLPQGPFRPIRDAGDETSVLSPQDEEQRFVPQAVELPASQAELPEKPTARNSTGEGQRKGSDDHRPATGSLAQGPFRPIRDPGDETSVLSSHDHEKGSEPQTVELHPSQAELPERPTGFDDHRSATGSLPQGPFRPIRDTGDETSVEEQK
jgi:hypothetical protein